MSKTRTDRVYVIDNADQMNHQTQNAFLKLLEEPVDHVHFILLTHHAEKLLPTVRSRVQQMAISPIDHEQSLNLLDELKVTDATARTQLLFLADGLPAELTRLVADKAGFQEKASAVTAARQFLQGTTLEKLHVISEYSASRPRTLTMLAYAERILSHSLRQNPSAALVERSNLIAESYDRIAANGHIKTQLMCLVV
jgi:DNA polymerase-3 subunit delta'